MRRSILISLGSVLLLARVSSAQTTGSISGTVTLFETAFEIRPAIQVYDATGLLVRTVDLGLTDTVRPSSIDTIPWSALGLAPGTYYVRTYNPNTSSGGSHVSFVSGPWVDQLFDKITCVAADCAATSGTPVVVTAGQMTGGISFTLDVGASITTAGNAMFLGAQSFDIFDARGVQLPNRISAGGLLAPGYHVNGLPAGSYYFLAHRSFDNFAPETLYPDRACDGCAVTSGTPIAVALGDNTTVNFATPPSGGISGTVRSDASANPPNAPLSGADVQVYAANGVLVTATSAASDGTYSISALAPGSYYVVTLNNLGFVDEEYSGVPCSGCPLTTGTPVAVAAGGTTTGIDFSLPQGTDVSGSVHVGGGPVAKAPVTFYTSSPGSPVARVLTAASLGGSFGSFEVRLPQGTYYVQTGPLPGTIEQIYNGVACPQGNCPTASATQIVIGPATPNSLVLDVPACMAPIVAPVSLANAAVGARYHQTLLATGATGAVGFTVTSGMLPPGLMLDPNTGVLSGTPTTSGRFTFTVTAVDMSACAGSRTYTLDVPACVTNIVSSWVAPAIEGGWQIDFTTTCGSVTATTNTPWLSGVNITFSIHNGVTIPELAFHPAQNTGPQRRGTITIGSRTVTIIQQAGGASDALPFGSVDAPADGAVVSGSVGISGWALDDYDVYSVDIYRDPVAGEAPQQVFIGHATFVPGARPDVQAAFPTYPHNDRAGWGYLLLTNMLPNRGDGTFRLLAYANSDSLSPGVTTNQRTLIGTKIINAVNATATAPFGAIDTPDQGATVSGTALVNFGWALTPQPKMIPFDGSTIHVLIDGVDAGPVNAYNLFRPDVAGLFSGLKNSGGPVGYRVIDTTALSEGTHTIAWLATDDAGITTGIGSRYFTVSNSAWQPSLRANFAAVPQAVSASELSQASAVGLGVSRDRWSAVPARVDGVDLGRKAESLAALPIDEAGARTVTIANLQALELSLVGSTDCPATYAGYLVANDELRALPVGSALDPVGTFYWHPGPGFFGTYHLLFVRTSCDGSQQKIPVSVHIR